MVIWDVKWKNFPTSYLGLLLGAAKKALSIWKKIIEKTEKKLANWKKQYLSLGGREVLINTVLDVFVSYPSYGHTTLDKIRRNFLWKEIKKKSIQ